MQLLDSLYRIENEEIAPSKAIYTIVLDASHPIYAGHFPGNPITPGVVILQIISELAERALGRTLQVKEFVNVKYLNVLSPVEHPNVQVELALAEAAPEVKVKAAILADGAPMSKVSAIYE